MKIIRTYKWIVAYILGISLFWSVPFSAELLKALDLKCAYFFNSLLGEGRAIQYYWAFTNSPLMDWVFDLIILSFFLYYIFLGIEKTRLYRLIATLGVVGYAFIAHFSKVGVEHVLHASRSSPSIVLPDLNRLHDFVPHLQGRIQSLVCYPADHAHTIIIMILSVVLLMGKRIGFACFLIAIPFFLPRLVVGAHWISDIYGGSLPFTLIMYGWLLTPGIFEKVVALLMKKLNLPHLNRKELPDTSHTA